MASVAAGSLSCKEDSPPPSGWKITVVVLKQLGAGPELVHCHAILTLEAFLTSAVTPVGVGGAGIIYCITNYKANYKIMDIMYIPLACKETILGALVLLI